MRVVGIAQDRSVVTCKVQRKGLLADNGANAYMPDSEENLVDCHDIPPVAIRLAIGGEEETSIHKCTHMGYLEMRCEDGVMHRQPILITEMQRTA